MTGLKWWMRVVGALYLFLFVASAGLKTPIKIEGPVGLLNQAAAGDRTAEFVVDTWVTLGAVFGAIGAGLLVASRIPHRAIALVWTVIGLEATAIVVDVYKIMRGYDVAALVMGIVIHSVIIAAGLEVVRRASRFEP